MTNIVIFVEVNKFISGTVLLVYLPICQYFSFFLRQPLEYISRSVEEGKIQPVLDSVLAPIGNATVYICLFYLFCCIF
jgi:hypothetical protein